MKRIGILTAGGDCPGLNAVLRAVGKTLLPHNIELIGFEDGFLGVLERRYRTLGHSELSGILALGGTILGTSNRDNPFLWKAANAPKEEEFQNRSAEVGELAKELGLEGLIVVGGDGSMHMAERLNRQGILRTIGVPKTIDNDLNATDVTFGFDTACSITMDAIDRLHSTAMSHHRAMVVEVMGRYAGWIALYAGVAGGGDVILIPEIPYDIDVVNETVLKRSKLGKRFSIVVVAEGAKNKEGKMVVDRVIEGSTDPIRLGGIGAMLARDIETATGVESRATILGHLQRGGSPTNRDRLLATQFGYLAAQLVMANDWGKMAAIQGGKFVAVPLAEAIGELKLVSPDDPLVESARAIGTVFGG